jgi:hypothetical protein
MDCLILTLQKGALLILALKGKRIIQAPAEAFMRGPALSALRLSRRAVRLFGFIHNKARVAAAAGLFDWIAHWDFENSGGENGREARAANRLRLR